MPLKTVDVVGKEGRVCYVTDKGHNRYVTVECPVEMVAYRLHWDGVPVQPGDWVTFQGKARMEVISSDVEEEKLRVIPYYHTPYDGSTRAEWSYLDVVETENLVKIGPPDKLETLRTAEEALSRHIKNWYGSNFPQQIQETLDALEAATDVMRSSFKEAKTTVEETAFKTVTVDLEI